MTMHGDPLTWRYILAGLIVTVVGGLILAVVVGVLSLDTSPASTKAPSLYRPAITATPPPTRVPGATPTIRTSTVVPPVTETARARRIGTMVAATLTAQPSLAPTATTNSASSATAEAYYLTTSVASTVAARLDSNRGPTVTAFGIAKLMLFCALSILGAFVLLCTIMIIFAKVFRIE